MAKTKNIRDIKKQRRFLKIALTIIFILLFIFAIFLINKLKLKDKEETNMKKIFCKPEQRDADVCIELFEPVCGFDRSGRKINTYSNSCFACMDNFVDYYISGECI